MIGFDVRVDGSNELLPCRINSGRGRLIVVVIEAMFQGSLVSNKTE